MSTIDLVKPPQKVLGCSIDIISARIIWKVLVQWRTGQLLSEQVDFVEEEDDTRPHEPSRIDDRVKEH